MAATADTGRWTALRRFTRLLKPDSREIAYIYIYAAFAGIVTFTLPLGIQAIIGLIAGGRVSSSLVILIGVVTMGTLFAGFLQIMQLTVTETIQRRIYSRSAFEFALRIPRLRLDQLQREYPPELANRFFDTMTIQKGLPKILVDLSTAILQILFGLILISFYHPFFVFFSVAVLVVLILIFRLTGPAGLRSSLVESKYKYKMAHWLQEIARALPTFKLASASQLPLGRTNKLIHSYLEARGQHFRILVGQYSAMLVFRTVVTAVLLGLGSMLVVDNQLNIGQFVAAEIIILLVLSSVEKLILTMDVIYDTLTGLEKVGQVTDLELEQESGLNFSSVDTGRGMSVQLEDITFRFEDNDRPTLQGINLSIAPGEKVCLAGYNGSGKSTLIQIIAGLILNYQGSLSYNGIPAGNYNLSSLRHAIGDHSSQEDIFPGTLLENICLGHLEVDFATVVKAVEQVGLTRFVQKLPLGYETELIPGGRNLPQNVITKIILARCLVSNPRLIAMEEFLRMLPANDRLGVVETITNRDSPWTLLAVSNDPIMAARCDRIVIMKSGKIVSEGTYGELQSDPHFEQIFLAPNPLHNGTTAHPDPSKTDYQD